MAPASKSPYEILLYYKYVTIRNPEACARAQRELCERLGLTGRIIIAHEGINGTVEGTREATQAYIDEMTSKCPFRTIHWKRSEGTGNAFPRLSVRVRPEIVSLHLPRRSDVDPRTTTGTRLSPDELRAWYARGDDFVVIDMRNDYEHKVGKFAGSICPPMKNFRDLPNVLPALKPYARRRVVTVCTGGVRCEKASGYLKKKGFRDVYQLDGGIVSYMERYPGHDFEGALYVFDGRTTMAFDPKKGKRTIIGSCESCGTQTERYPDCANPSCLAQMLICTACAERTADHTCSSKCARARSRALA